MVNTASLARLQLLIELFKMEKWIRETEAYLKYSLKYYSEKGFDKNTTDAEFFINLKKMIEEEKRLYDECFNIAFADQGAQGGTPSVSW